jgi:D-alanyl-D-alanine carboxypeptidase
LKNKIIVLSLALSVLSVAAAFAARPGKGQSQGSTKTVTASIAPEVETNVRPTAAIRERRSVAPSGDASAFTAAASQNLLLKNELGWAFGGKQQRGWYLYASLISRLIETEADPSSPEFASALAVWQRKAGLAATGVLNDETLYKMVSTWQGARIKDRAYPTPEQLVTAPPSEFWDPSRPEELRRVRADAYAAYKRMVADAAKDPSLGLATTKTGELAPEEKFLKLVSSFRSREYQEELRRRSPNAGRAGLAVNSPHFTGRALDIYVGGDPVDTKDANRLVQVNTPVYKWLVRNAGKYGFRPYYYEPWHWEYVGGAIGEGK